jgi:hypothetical protein
MVSGPHTIMSAQLWSYIGFARWADKEHVESHAAQKNLYHPQSVGSCSTHIWAL